MVDTARDVFDVPSCSGHTSRMERTLEEVGQAVARRRVALGMDAAELARQAEVDPKTLASLERGERWPRDTSRARLEAALGWDTGSITRIRNGDEPVVSGVIRSRSGRPISQWTSTKGGEQEELELYRLAYLIADTRDLVRTQKGPLMTALTALLDEATELLVRQVARWRNGGEVDAKAVADAQWFIDETRDSNNIRRRGEIYVLDSENGAANVHRLHAAAPVPPEVEHPDDAPPAVADAARKAPPGYTPGQPEQGNADGEESQAGPGDD